MKYLFFFFILIIYRTVCYSQVLPYKDPSLSVDERVKDLLSRMTPEEKAWQLFMIPGSIEKGDEKKYLNGIFGFQFSTSAPGKDANGQMLNYNISENALALIKKINASQKYFVEQTRLGIPIIAFDEALHGVVRDGATVFPQSIGLAASWDTVLMHNVAVAIAEEARARGIRQVLSPVINIASDARWGRVEETYGEDPFLSSEMGVAFVSAFEKMNIITTPKHFIANVGDGGRDSYPIQYNERLLDEIYFPPFKAVVERAGARSIMASYNSLDGIPATANSWLLNKVLKGDWKFKGFVISDASGVGGANVLHYTSPDNASSAAQAMNNGLDVIFQTAYEHFRLFGPPFFDGRIAQKNIDEAVSRVLRAKFEIGLFEHPYVDEAALGQWINNKSHKDLAKQAALESIVLLKNEINILPLSKRVRTIAVIGPDASTVRLGGYSGPGTNAVSILDGIKERAGSNIKVLYAKGCKRKDETWTLVPSASLSHKDSSGKIQNGLKGEYFKNITLEGLPAISRTDQQINFQWTFNSPGRGISNDFYSVRWTGSIHSPKSGQYKIGLDGDDGYRLYLDGRLVIDAWYKQSYHTELITFGFEKGKDYDIRIEFFEPAGNAHIKLVWNEDVEDDHEARIQEALTAAKNADVIIVTAGIQEGEFQDRSSLALPGHQSEEIEALAKTGKPVVVVLIGGSAISMSPWLEKVDAVLDAWYPGEQGGNALASVLFGDDNPCGRLPVSFPISDGQLPLVYNHKPTGRGDDYNDLSGLPLFPFGFGLGYSRFEYSNLRLDSKSIAKNDSVMLHCTIKNTGAKEGDEVVQLYLRDMIASVARPVMELKGFQRIHLAPGESKEVSFLITPAMLSMLDERLQTVIEPGDFRIMIGASSRDIRLKDVLNVK